MSPILPLLLLASSVSAQASLQSLISNYGLTSASFNYTAPTRALESDDAYDWIKENWDLTGNKIDYGIDDMWVWFNTGKSDTRELTDRAFTADPSTVSSTVVRRQNTRSQSSSRSSSASAASSSAASATGAQAPITTALSGQEPVFRVGYPAGSYSGSTGGTQFYSQALNSSGQAHERMLLSYDVWFPQGYAWVICPWYIAGADGRWNRGGKLPGLRGGPDARGCSGGSASDGEHCFSTRLMWRTSGAGEGTFTSNTSHESWFKCTDDSLRIHPYRQGPMWSNKCHV